MGARARRLTAFKLEHPYCCLCGGGVETETIEHAPPKIMFFRSQRPKGLEVPACVRCNNGSSQQDQFAALLACTRSPALISGGEDSPDELKHFKKLVDGVGNNTQIGPLFDAAPDRLVQVNGLIQRFKQIKIKTSAFDYYLFPLAAKQALAMWYDMTGTVFIENGSINILWIDPKTINTSTHVQRFLSTLPISGGLSQGTLNVDDQFQYKVGISDDQTVGVYWPVFHQSFTFLVFLDTDASRSAVLNTKAFKTGATLSTSNEKGIFVENSRVWNAP